MEVLAFYKKVSFKKRVGKSNSNIIQYFFLLKKQEKASSSYLLSNFYKSRKSKFKLLLNMRLIKREQKKASFNFLLIILKKQPRASFSS